MFASAATFTVRTSLLLLASTFILAASCLAQTTDEASVEAARAERAEKLEAKAAEVKKAFLELKSKWNEASDQAKANLGAEVDAARSEWLPFSG